MGTKLHVGYGWVRDLCHQVGTFQALVTLELEKIKLLVYHLSVHHLKILVTGHQPCRCRRVEIIMYISSNIKFCLLYIYYICTTQPWHVYMYDTYV